MLSRLAGYQPADKLIADLAENVGPARVVFAGRWRVAPPPTVIRVAAGGAGAGAAPEDVSASDGVRAPAGLGSAQRRFSA